MKRGYQNEISYLRVEQFYYYNHIVHVNFLVMYDDLKYKFKQCKRLNAIIFFFFLKKRC